MTTKARKPKTEWRYEITVWNITNGDVVAYSRDADENERERLEEMYGDEPLYDIVIDDEWEEEVDD